MHARPLPCKPLTMHAPHDMVNELAVRILVECILVVWLFLTWYNYVVTNYCQNRLPALFGFFIMSNEGLNESYIHAEWPCSSVLKKFVRQRSKFELQFHPSSRPDVFTPLFYDHSHRSEIHSHRVYPLGNLTGKLCTRHTIQKTRITGNSIL